MDLEEEVEREAREGLVESLAKEDLEEWVLM